MKLFEALNIELHNVPEGEKIPYYYETKGFRKNPSAQPLELRSNGTYVLFAETPVYILPSEIIAGNLFSVYKKVDPAILMYMKRIYDGFNHRVFRTNNDHFVPAYHLILKGGINGMLNDIALSRTKHKDELKCVETLDAMEKTLHGFKKMIENYLSKAKSLLNTSEYDNGRLMYIIRNCEALLVDAPKTFGQALQLVWFCHNAFRMENRSAIALGRMDQYLYRFYKNDIDNGTIDRFAVIELLENIFVRLQGDTVNICIGGTNADGSCAINELSECILEAVKNCQVPGPNLSVRLTTDTPDEFLDKCLQSIGTGIGYPALMNDEINIKALSRFGYGDDVYDYCMVGCIENFISGRQPPWTDGRFDTPRLFEYVFNRGVSKFNGNLGVDTGELSCVKTMHQFVCLFEKQLDYYVAEYYGLFQALNNGINQEFFPNPFLSCFCEDCIGKGLDVNNGGAKYPSVHGAVIMGIGTVADSMAAIEKVVFEDKYATLEELRDALNSNFVGYENLREQLLAAPKYGNNDEFVDKYAVWLVDATYQRFSNYKTRDGGAYYICMAANTANISAGKMIGATPDGRLAGEPISDAASPTYGRDIRGATATMHSLSKPDYSFVATGSVVNQKYSPSMFSDEKRPKLLALIRTYFANGGQEIQINATSREVLCDAMEHPDKYPNLVVRVSGYSAYFVTLDRAVQLDILNRTQKD